MPILISKEKDDDDRLYVSFNYTEDRIRRIKKIQGNKWSYKNKSFSVPNTKETIDRIVLAFYDEEVMLDASLI
ncbi:hypothetical protein [Clostridium oceanicum]|uniref:Uncharacterized protein n=1 Tax=Clostridium oceanicum TaxID=1543 RepID=A0ABN1JXD6_9CLOT